MATPTRPTPTGRNRALTPNRATGSPPDPPAIDPYPFGSVASRAIEVGAVIATVLFFCFLLRTRSVIRLRARGDRDRGNHPLAVRGAAKFKGLCSPTRLRVPLRHRRPVRLAPAGIVTRADGSRQSGSWSAATTSASRAQPHSPGAGAHSHGFSVAPSSTTSTWIVGCSPSPVDKPGST